MLITTAPSDDSTINQEARNCRANNLKVLPHLRTVFNSMHNKDKWMDELALRRKWGKSDQGKEEEKIQLLLYSF